MLLQNLISGRLSLLEYLITTGKSKRWEKQCGDSTPNSNMAILTSCHQLVFAWKGFNTYGHVKDKSDVNFCNAYNVDILYVLKRF